MGKISASEIWPHKGGGLKIGGYCIRLHCIFENKSLLCDIVISGIKDHKPNVHVYPVVIE